ncbi:homologous-pairing protein 2 homolog [Pristis pectinata]|uniref:homologous-pairing protein 2 homolog n=1 Tax=Pristis pectinata TaxID=685728 RepID=UPI00223D0B3F|nr:homologous-pairing protein 2 homolog [Pristis pectinata]
MRGPGRSALAVRDAMSKHKDCAVTSIILKYLTDQNRPFSAQDIFGNLQREYHFGKTVAVKALEQLAQDGKIKEKVYGKQKIYFADQRQFTAVGEADLKTLDNQICELSEKFQNLQQSCRQMEAELKELNNSMTTQEMSVEIAALKQECASHRERLQKIKSTSNHVTPEDKEQVYNERKQYIKEWRKRKRMATDLIDAVLEGYPKSRKQFYEEVGIETDEDHSIAVPDL